MTDQDDFLSRWSRRKREVAEAEAKPETPTPAPETPDVTESPAALSHQEGPPSAASAEPLFDPASLPSIESITAETDIRGFLAPGVPPDLVRAALRRAWSADPAIRDFIGLSENSWDFNAPGSMGGFGPLEMTDDLRRMVAQLFTPVREQNSAHAATHQTAEIPDAPAPETPPHMQTARNGQDEIVENKEEKSAGDGLPPDSSGIAAPQQASAGQKIAVSSSRRYHGGALPK